MMLLEVIVVLHDILKYPIFQYLICTQILLIGLYNLPFLIEMTKAQRY